MTAQELLTIDVDAEVCKLCGQQFAGPKDRVVELLRTLLRGGAREVDLDISAKEILIRATGIGWSEDAWHSLARIGDARVESTQRHEALLFAEGVLGAGALGLLAEPQCSLTCGTLVLRWRGGRLQDSAGEPTQHGDVTIRIRRRVRVKALRAHLERACRFADVPMRLSGELMSGGMRLEDAFGAVAVTGEGGGIRGVMGLPRGGTVCRTRILRHQLVAKSLVGVSPSGYVHEAVIELGDEHPMDDQLPRDVRSVLLDGRLGAYRQAVEAFDRWLPEERRRVVELLTACAREPAVAGWLKQLPIFERLEGGALRASELESIARDGAVWAVEPGDPVTEWLAPLKEILVIDEAAREYLYSTLGFQVVSPPRRARDAVWRRVWSRARDLARRIRSGASQIPTYVMGQRMIEPGDLSVEERALLDALQAEVQSGAVTPPYRDAAQVPLCFVSRGSMPVRPRRLGGRLVFPIPRRHPVTQRAVLLFHQDGSNLLPICMAVFGGLFGSRARHHELLRAFGEPSKA